MGKARVLLADDHKIFREGLAGLISMEEDLSVVAEASNGEEAIGMTKKLSPDIAVFDITMPKISGLEALRTLSRTKCDTRFIMLTMLDEQEIFDEAISLGVSGYLLKEDSADDLIVAIRSALEGNVYISPAMSGKLLGNREAKKSLYEKNAELSQLGQREMDVLKCLASNMTSKEIGKELFISYRTVQHHRSSIMKKLGIDGRNQLLEFAINNRKYL